MVDYQIYLDNTSLVRWFLKRFHPEKHKQEPQIIKFLNEHKREIKSFVSTISIAELVHTLRHGEAFEKFNLNFNYIKELIGELQDIIGFDIIQTEKIDGTEIDGVIVSNYVVKYVFKHKHLTDCIHVDIARQHELTFVTYETAIGELKEYYDNIMTEEKLMKQFN